MLFSKLKALLRHAADVAGLAQQALAAPISLNDAEGVRLLLEAGADPGRDWLAMLAAWHVARAPLRCASAGTAYTIDLVDSGGVHP